MADYTTDRRLAAVLVADIAGYTQRIEKDEEGTVAAWQAARADVIDPVVTDHSGRIVKLTGDGFLAEFKTIIDAIRCSVAIQSGLADSALDFRIGVSLGDVIDDGEDIHGEGVNVAARIEALADPGGVSITGEVYSQIRRRLDLEFVDLGEHDFKNVSTPVHVYKIIVPGPEAASAPASPEPSGGAAPVPPGASDGPSIAVLPFDNVSGDPEQEYFSDGISEDLITDLSKIQNLRVASRHSSFSFKGQSSDMQEIAGKLGVTYVLEGSVRKSGDRVRINAQLIETATDGHVWADRYDGPLDDIFALQDEITEKIVAALHVQLTAQEAARPRKRITDSIEAYEIYLQGRAELYRMDPNGTLAASHLMRRAIKIDPNFAAAHATLSGAVQHGWVFAFPGFDDAYDEILPTAQRSVELDSSLGLAHARLGWALTFEGRYREAITSFEHAVELEPNHAETYLWFTEALNYAGDPVRGAVTGKKAMEMEPFDTPPVYNLVAGHSHYLLRNYGMAEALFRNTISKAPGFPLPYLLLGVVYFEMGRAEDAAAQFAVLYETMPPHVLDAVVSRLPYRDDEPQRRIRDALDSASQSA
jgi:adenylate cyclase